MIAKFIAVSGVLILGTGVTAVIAGGSGPDVRSNIGYSKTIRPSASSIYRSYEDMVSRADAIFVGRPQTSLNNGKGVIDLFPNSTFIRNFYTPRTVKVAKIIKNNGNIDIKSGKVVDITEFATLAKLDGAVVRIIGPDYEELIEGNKYLFFVYKTEQGNTILFGSSCVSGSWDEGQGEKSVQAVQNLAFPLQAAPLLILASCTAKMSFLSTLAPRNPGRAFYLTADLVK